jgi:hypothetical protein
VRGAFTAKSNPGHTEFGTAPLKGDALRISGRSRMRTATCSGP